MKIDKVTEIATMLANDPKTKASEVVKKFKVSKIYAYNLMSKARKKIDASPFGQTNAKREKLAVDLLKHMSVHKDIVSAHHTDMVNHPPHYTQGGIETIDFIEAKELGYNLGNAVKYITRSDHKGNKHEDLCKARWYLNREISKLTK